VSAKEKKKERRDEMKKNERETGREM